MDHLNKKPQKEEAPSQWGFGLRWTSQRYNQMRCAYRLGFIKLCSHATTLRFVPQLQNSFDTTCCHLTKLCFVSMRPVTVLLQHSIMGLYQLLMDDAEYFVWPFSLPISMLRVRAIQFSKYVSH
jgi:hypothetical protein